MQNKFYQWMMQLQITKAERRVVYVVLFIVVLVQSIAYFEIFDQKEEFDYSEAKLQFAELAKEIQHRDSLILLRYTQPELILAGSNGEKGLGSSASSKTRKKQKPALQEKSINPNSASQADLERIPGIGPVTAARIIAYRQKNGLFTSLEDMVKVKGIGKKTLETIKPYLTLD